MTILQLPPAYTVAALLIGGSLWMMHTEFALFRGELKSYSPCTWWRKKRNHRMAVPVEDTTANVRSHVFEYETIHA